MSNNCLRIGLLLSLLQCSHQSCLAGTASQCKNADFPPGINLAGEGFDITKMARKGAFVIDLKLWEHKDKTCTLCPNPFLEGKTNTLQSSGADKQHGRVPHNMADSAHGSMSSSSKSSASYLSLSKSHSALSDAKSVGNLSEGRLHPDDTGSNAAAAAAAAVGVGVAVPGARYFPSSCLDLNAPAVGPPAQGTLPGSPSARHSDRSGHSPASRSGGNGRMESSTLDSSSRHKSRHKAMAPGRSAASYSKMLPNPYLNQEF